MKMNKYFLCLALLFACIACLVSSASAADNAESARYVLTTAAIADASTGDCVEVDSSGLLQVDVASMASGVTVLGAGSALIGETKPTDNDGDHITVDSDGALEVAEDAVLAEDCTEAELVLTGAGRFYGYTMVGASAGDTVTIYDNTSGTGTVIARGKLGTNLSESGSMVNGGVAVSNGIFVAGTDSDVDTIVYYKS